MCPYVGSLIGIMYVHKYVCAELRYNRMYEQPTFTVQTNFCEQDQSMESSPECQVTYIHTYVRTYVHKEFWLNFNIQRQVRKFVCADYSNNV